MRRYPQRRLPFLLALVAICLPPISKAGTTQSGPTLLKYSIQVTADRLVHYWKTPDVDNYWSWLPRVNFVVLGPSITGTIYSIDFTNPDGSPWYSVDCASETIEAGRWGAVGTPVVTTHVDKRTTLATGVFGFKIRVKNEVMGTNATLFTGKFKVNKFHVGNTLPAFKNQFEYYVDQDWRLPIGYLWLTPQDPKNPVPVATMWFRGESDNTKLAAYLFYNGKQIASTREQTGSAGSDLSLLTSGNDKDPRWERWNFRWNQVRAFNADENNKSAFFLLNSNPGEYEVKVLRDGDLARSMKFTIGVDGTFADNGVAKQNNLGWFGLLLPVKVIGTSDGTWDANAWKTEAFYGNPLTGFSVP
jgi:hypothetical protein